MREKSRNVHEQGILNLNEHTMVKSQPTKTTENFHWPVQENQNFF